MNRSRTDHDGTDQRISRASGDEPFTLSLVDFGGKYFPRERG